MRPIISKIIFIIATSLLILTLAGCAGTKVSGLKSDIGDQSTQLETLATALQARALEIQRSYDTRIQAQLANDPRCIPTSTIDYWIVDGKLVCEKPEGAAIKRTYEPGGNATVFWATSLIKVLVDYQRILAAAVETKPYDSAAELKALAVKVDYLQCKFNKLKKPDSTEDCPSLSSDVALDEENNPLDAQIKAAGSLADIVRAAINASDRENALKNALTDDRAAALEGSLRLLKGRLVVIPGLLSVVEREKSAATAYIQYRNVYGDCNEPSNNKLARCKGPRIDAFKSQMQLYADNKLNVRDIDPLSVAINTLITQHAELRHCLVADECTVEMRNKIAKETRQRLFDALKASVALAKELT